MRNMRDDEVLARVRAASERIGGLVRETPLEHSLHLSRETGANVYLKLECQQTTGSFKLRGAMNKILALDEESGEPRTVVTASSGNHAAAVAHTLHGLGRQGIIYLPETVAPAKVKALEPYGMELRFVGRDSVVGEIEARRAAEGEGFVFVSPYSDPDVIGGQGTVGVEIERQLDAIDAVLVPVGGGGLIAGVAGYLKTIRPGVRIVGCQPEASAVMAESVRAGRIVSIESEETLADGTAGGIEPDALTFPLCQRYVDEYVLVSEAEIAAAMRRLLETHYLVVEGAAALTLAALRKRPERYRGGNVVLVLTGKKVSVDVLTQVLAATG